MNRIIKAFALAIIFRLNNLMMMIQYGHYWLFETEFDIFFRKPSVVLDIKMLYSDARLLSDNIYLYLYLE